MLPPTTSSLRYLTVRSHCFSGFLNQFSRCEFPSLRELKVVNCSANLPTCLFSHTLTHLTLVASHTNNRCHLNASHFAESLSQMKGLVTLIIRRMHFSGRHQISPQQHLSPIHLPRLQALQLELPHSCYHSYLPLLESLKMPPSTKACIRFQDSHQDLEPSTLYSPILSLFEAQTIRSLSFIQNSYDGVFSSMAGPKS